MKLVTIAELSTLTGKTQHTVKKRLARLEPESGKKYNSKEALFILYVTDQPTGDLELDQERAKLARAQTVGKNLDNEHKLKNLIELNDVLDAVASEYSILRRRLLACPSDASTQIIYDYNLNQDQQHKLTNIILESVNEALEDLQSDSHETLLEKVNEIEYVRNSKKISRSP